LRKFEPIQLGVGSKGGAEAIVHAMRAFVEEYGDDPTYSLLQNDVKNAYTNSADREIFLEETRKEAQGLYIQRSSIRL
jgi:hypothetical protein